MFNAAGSNTVPLRWKQTPQTLYLDPLEVHHAVAEALRPGGQSSSGVEKGPTTASTEQASLALRLQSTETRTLLYPRFLGGSMFYWVVFGIIRGLARTFICPDYGASNFHLRKLNYMAWGRYSSLVHLGV